jgi:hypothetical protein
VWTEAPAEVWNLEVHRAHTYRVGGAGVLVHNDGPDECGEGLLPKPPTRPGAVPLDERDPKRLWTPSERAAKRDAKGAFARTGAAQRLTPTTPVGTISIGMQTEG